MVFGKPKVGKSTFAQQLAKAMNLEFIDLESQINMIFAKIKLNEEDA